ncbi:MAG: phage holin family protein [Gemmatimonadetes bacterium]|nr:phage holin family protein [Gemmatimonadota bacterium]
MATRREPPEAGPEQAEVEAEAETAGPDDAGSTAALLRGVIAESTRLLRQEIELARAEMGEKADLLQRYVAGVAAGGALLACAFFFLLSALDRGFGAALATWMDERIAGWLAPLILAAILGGVGFWLLSNARRALRSEGLTPERTVETLRENTHWIKERLR